MKPIPTETATDVGSVGKWLGAAAAGALLMYLLDPERGAARRSRAASAVRRGTARTGAAVDHALHSAGAGIGALTGSAADAIARGAGKLQAQAAPLIERARHGAQDARDSVAAKADQARERASREAEEARQRYDAGSSREYASRNRYDYDDRYDDGDRFASDAAHGGGLAGLLNGLGERLGHVLGSSSGRDSALLGGSLVGLLGVMRRNPAGLLVGLAGLALLMRSTGTRRYSVGSLALPPTRHLGGPSAATAPGASTPGASTPGASTQGATASDESAPYLPSSTEPGGRTLH